MTASVEGNAICLGVDRRCWLFIAQFTISLMIVGSCLVMIFLGIENAFAQSMLTLIAGVWIPNPNAPKTIVPTAYKQTKLSSPTRWLLPRQPEQDAKEEEAEGVDVGG